MIFFPLQTAYGGRITVFQQSLPNAGAGGLNSREDPNARAGSVSKASINPSTDFYKKMALELSGKQIAADFFFLNTQYIDIATLCKYCILSDTTVANSKLQRSTCLKIFDTIAIDYEVLACFNNYLHSAFRCPRTCWQSLVLARKYSTKKSYTSNQYI